MSVKTVQVIIKGVTTTLTLNSQTGKYDGTITAPTTSSFNENDGHYYPVGIKALDEAGNTDTADDVHETLGESLRLRVRFWQKPKTDWRQEGDFFNIQDYNRIKGNLNEIRAEALILWPDFDFEDMGEDKKYSDYSFYADEINRFEANVDLICAGTYPFSVGVRQTFQDNQPFIGWQELNRLEDACRIMYENITGRRNGLPRLSFTLGNRRLFNAGRR